MLATVRNSYSFHYPDLDDLEAAFQQAAKEENDEADWGVYMTRGLLNCFFMASDLVIAHGIGRAAAALVTDVPTPVLAAPARTMPPPSNVRRSSRPLPAIDSSGGDALPSLRRLRMPMALSFGDGRRLAPICPAVFLKWRSFRANLPSIGCSHAQSLPYTNDLTPQNIAKDYRHTRPADATSM